MTFFGLKHQFSAVPFDKHCQLFWISIKSGHLHYEFVCPRLRKKPIYGCMLRINSNYEPDTSAQFLDVMRSADEINRLGPRS